MTACSSPAKRRAALSALSTSRLVKALVAIARAAWPETGAALLSVIMATVTAFPAGMTIGSLDHPELTPIERHFGISRGHIHHVDNAYGFTDRLAYETPIAGLYSASAGCHPAGSVIGAAGHNAAMRVLQDLDAKVARA